MSKMAGCFLLSVVIIFLNFNIALSDDEECLVDADCPNDTFCYKKRVCAPCFDCQIVNRQNSSECNHTTLDCGDCLPGFYYEPLTIEASKRRRPPCYRRRNGCEEDESCANGNFCNGEECVPCFECALYQRLRPSDGCAKEPNECGLCLPGYEEEPVTIGARQKPCTRKDASPPLSQNTEVNVNVNDVTGLLIIIAAITIVAVGLAVAYYYWKSKQVSAPEGEPARSPSPPAYLSAGEERELVCGFHKELIRDNECTAQIFRRPSYNYGPCEFHELQDGSLQRRREQNDQVDNVEDVRERMFHPPNYGEIQHWHDVGQDRGLQGPDELQHSLSPVEEVIEVVNGSGEDRVPLRRSSSRQSDVRSEDGRQLTPVTTEMEIGGEIYAESQF